MKWTKDDIQNSLKTLADGGILLYPTDTIWGIGCDATDPKAVRTIFRLKNRKDEKSMIVLVKDERDIEQYVDDPDPRTFDYLKEMNRPVTVVYNGAKGLANNLLIDGTIAIRICMDEFCRQLLSEFGKPIVSTSANISGYPSPKTFEEISPEVRKRVDYIVKYRQEDVVPAIPSMVIRWADGNPIVLRS